MCVWVWCDVNRETQTHTQLPTVSLEMEFNSLEHKLVSPLCIIRRQQFLFVEHNTMEIFFFAHLALSTLGIVAVIQLTVWSKNWTENNIIREPKTGEIFEVDEKHLNIPSVGVGMRKRLNYPAAIRMRIPTSNTNAWCKLKSKW